MNQGIKTIIYPVKNIVQAQQPVRDAGGGKLIASVKDADGNVTGKIQRP